MGITNLISLVVFACALVQRGALAESERPADFVDIQEAAYAPHVVVSMAYSGRDNFTGRQVAGYHRNICYLSKAAATRLARLQRQLEKNHESLKLYDCYRPLKAVYAFYQWMHAETEGPSDYYDYRKVSRKSFEGTYISGQSSHSRGHTVDLSYGRWVDGRFNEYDMGSRFDYFGPISHHAARAGLSREAIANRERLRQLMRGAGFRSLYSEWWHYTLVDEPSQKAFDFDVR